MVSSSGCSRLSMLGVVLKRNVILCTNPLTKAEYVTWGWVAAMLTSLSNWLCQSLLFVDTNSLVNASGLRWAPRYGWPSVTICTSVSLNSSLASDREKCCSLTTSHILWANLRGIHAKAGPKEYWCSLTQSRGGSDHGYWGIISIPNLELNISQWAKL